MYGNSAQGNGPNIAGNAPSNPVTFHYSLVEGGWSGEGKPGVSNISGDPLFRDPAAGKLQVLASSPVVDAGSDGLEDNISDEPISLLVPELDLIGKQREGKPDMGAYEVTARLHPADRNGDNVISISELTAYGSAWKTGEPWETEPIVIPVSYVTRAGFLWKEGEAYEDDGSELPGAWVPATQ